MKTSSLNGGCNLNQCVKCSIDKLVFTVNIPDLYDVRYFLDSMVKQYIKFEELKDVHELGDLRLYQYNYLFDDFYISFGCKTINEITGKDHIRIEFNPNKKKPEDFYYLFLKLPSSISKTIKFNRLDFAIDYYQELHPEYFFHPDKRKSHIYINSGKIETLYLGSEQSAIQYRIYNKKTEALKRLRLKAEDLTSDKINEIFLKENIDLSFSDLWRFEVQLRKKALSHVVHANHKPLEKLECYSGFKTGEYDFQHSFFLHAVKDLGLQYALKKIPRDTRKRYLTWCHDNSLPIAEHPRDIWNKHFNECFSDIKNRLHKILNKPEIDIYE